KRSEAVALFAKLAAESNTARDEVDRKIDAASEIAEAARQETVKLHEGDPENRRLWEQFMPHCRAALDSLYERLGVHFDFELGESFYDAMLAVVVADLESKGFASQSEGAT